jgi:phytoene dehydrogenase-like protein
MSDRWDAVIVGGGHNGLTAAAYLASAGQRVLVLERAASVGGAAVSTYAFDGIDARLSRYSYLVSLMPQRIIDDLRLPIELKRRRYSSFTPDPSDPTRGLLVDNGDEAATAASFRALTGRDSDHELFREFYLHTGHLAQRLFPTMTEPLLRRSEMRRLVDADPIWHAMIERPIGEVIEQHIQHDVVRGVVLTDALIGTFARAQEATLQQNICFLYHLIGGGTGDWDVPVGGMGAVSGALHQAAVAAGARIETLAEVTSVSPDGEVVYRQGDAEHRVGATQILANVTPEVLNRLLVAGGAPSSGPVRAEGAQLKVNLLLKRLPRLRDTRVDPTAAFAGTFHINEGYRQLDEAWLAADSGALPDPLPCEIYCHSLTDASILGAELAASGAQTLTLFGLHVPDRLLSEDNNSAMRERLQRAAIDSMNSVLAEPIEDLLLTDANGQPCIETRTTRDLEASLGMSGGNIFHGPLSWPFAEDDAALSTAAERWGVATAHDRVLLAGAGSQRGGGVSGLGGYSAAMAVLTS